MHAVDVLVIGAGMAGLTVATELQKIGLKIICVEKARGSGGRLSSKRLVSPKLKEPISFDLGCASFTAQTELFRSQIDQWVACDLAKVWRYSEHEGSHYVALPRSSMITRHLAEQLDVHFETRITRIINEKGYWQAFIQENEQEHLFAQAKHIVFATPPQQAADLIGMNHPFYAQLSADILLPQWVLMVYVQGHLALGGEFYEPEAGIISKLILEDSKPGRQESGNHQTWLLHAHPAWTKRHLETPKTEIVEALLAELADLSHVPLIVKESYLHRWLYSLPQKTPLSGQYFLNDQKGLWFCGDYLGESEHLKGVEAAFLSAHHLAKNFHAL